MFEVDVKNVTEKGREEGKGRGPAQVWGSDELTINLPRPRLKLTENCYKWRGSREWNSQQSPIGTQTGVVHI